MQPAPPPPCPRRSTTCRRCGGRCSRPGWTAGCPTCGRPPPPVRRPGARRAATGRLAARAFAARTDDLHRLDLKRSLEPNWFQRPEMVGYAAYADRFAGTLAGVAERASYLADLGVRYLHLMPLLTPRPAPNDGGYAVADFRSVRPDLGTTDDLRALTGRLRQDGISLCLDLVLNHVAREHPWARRRGPATRRTATTSWSTPTGRCRTRSSRRCRRCSRTSRPATSPGTTTWTAGSGRRSTTTSGTSTGRTPTCCASSPT